MLKRTPFHGFHQQFDPKLVDFAGWEMPIHYGSIIDEHNFTRTSGSIFDVSHMGRIKISGRHARRFLERLLTRRVSDMAPKTCRYSLVCNEQGGVLDDVLIYRFDDHWVLVVNASNREKILAHMGALKATDGSDFVVKIEDQTEATAMLAIQGPKVMDVIGRFSSEVPTLKYYGFCTKNLLIIKMTISRTGYTGEDGIEIMLPAKVADMAMKLLMKERGPDAPVKPAGLGARDSLRLEAGMPLYGHELDEETDPYAAGLGFAVALDKREDTNGEDFVGREALEKIKAEGPSKVLVGLKVDGKRTPRQGTEVHVNGEAVGTVTSGCMSPTLDCPIAMAYVKPGSCQVGDTVQVPFGAKSAEAEVVKTPFYKRAK